MIIQAQILDLLNDLKEKENMAMLFITHDLAVVRKIADRVYVMKDGDIVEHDTVEKVFTSPQHPIRKNYYLHMPLGHLMQLMRSTCRCAG